MLFRSARGFCDHVLPEELIFDERSRPRGTRCDLYDNEINVYGRDPKTRFAQRPLDNVGVQYGLRAFNEGKIEFEQFVELNEIVGGYDNDGRTVATRTVASPAAVHTAFANGLILTGGGGLAQTPILEWRPYSDDLADNHDDFRSFVTRARLAKTNGEANNHVLVVYPRYSTLNLVFFAAVRRWEVVFPEHARELVLQMDRWLDGIQSDSTPGSLAEKVARDRPTDVADGCWTLQGERIIEQASYDKVGTCTRLYPPHADPRIAAGGPLTDDVLKCELKPVDRTDYTHSLSVEQLSRLRAVFPMGVCDYTRPSVGYEKTSSTWRFF